MKVDCLRRTGDPLLKAAITFSRAAGKVLLGSAAIFLATGAHAKTQYNAAFAAAYPGSTSGTTASCALCHDSPSGGSLNRYGKHLFDRASSTDFAGVEGLTSMNVNGGTTNLDEISANAQPGWTTGRVNEIYHLYTGVLLSSSVLPPAAIGDLDPVVANDPPTADPGGPYNGVLNLPLTFDGSGSLDTDGTIVSYDWDFGDGSVGSGIGPNHSYQAAGTYTVSLTVTDDDNDTDSLTTTATIPAWADSDEGGTWKRRIRFSD
jgi:hypothetical protein